MQTFIMLTRLSPDALRSPGSLEELEQRVMGNIRTEFPKVEWLHNFAILGPCDNLDIFTRPSWYSSSMQVSKIEFISLQPSCCQ